MRWGRRWDEIDNDSVRQMAKRALAWTVFWIVLTGSSIPGLQYLHVSQHRYLGHGQYRVEVFPEQFTNDPNLPHFGGRVATVGPMVAFLWVLFPLSIAIAWLVIAIACKCGSGWAEAYYMAILCAFLVAAWFTIWLVEFLVWRGVGSQG